jgi:hypothetical protein
MRLKSLKATLFLLCVLVSVMALSNLNSVSSESASQLNFDSQFEVLNHQLYVSVTPALYNYYANLTHDIKSDSDYAKMVTPQAVKPIADDLRNITANLPNSDEQFADAVLSLVHQIPYNVTGARYPLETLVTNVGDCVGLSLLAASIMQAGGLEVVLIHYVGINPSHINVGVHLSHMPLYHSLFFAPTSFEYENKTYYAAEATGKMEWKIGDQSDMLHGAQAIIIPINNAQNHSNSLSASLDEPLLSSSIDLNLSEPPINNQNTTRALLLWGNISSGQPDRNVTAYIYRNGELFGYLTNATDSLGRFEFLWNFTSTGTYYIVASTSGDTTYMGADSQTLTVFVGPEMLVQFQTPRYNYILGHPGVGSYQLRPFVGITDFLNVSLGVNVTLSCDFTLIQTGHVAKIQTKTVTVPSIEQPHNQIGTQTSARQTFITPVSVPKGLEPLSLPDDFNQTINNQFCLLLQSNLGDNYSLSFKGLNAYDVSNLKNSVDVAVVNATENVEENVWYTFSSVISLKGITTKLAYTNGTVIQTSATPYDAAGNNSLAMLMANHIDSAVVFKDIKIQTLHNLPPQPTQTPLQTNEDNPQVSLYPIFVILLVGTVFTAAVAIYAKQKKRQTGNKAKTE